jgi:hypothetical protein
MTKSLAYTTVPDPAGGTPEQWAKEIRILKQKGWLQDPLDVLAGARMDPENAEALLHKGRVCLRVCWRPKCKRAKRCCFMMPLAIRENRHRMWTQGPAADGSDADEPVLIPASKIRRLPIFPFRGKAGKTADALSGTAARQSSGAYANEAGSDRSAGGRGRRGR